MNKHLVVSETFDFKPSSRQYLDNGFLRVSGKAARTGVYEYLACELGLTDRAPTEIVRVYRPEEEVFNDASIQSYSNVDVTNDHPTKFVDAETYKKISVGHVISAVRDGDFVNVDVIVKDKQAIQDVESGKTQLSPGYSAGYVAEDGVSPCGTNYEFKQTAIDVNHLAIVSRGRGGSQVRLNDNQPQPEKIMKKVSLDSGRSVELEDGATATLIQDSFDRLNEKATDAEAKLVTVQATADAQADKITKLEADLKTATDSNSLTEKLAELSKVKDSALKIAGKSFTCDSVDSMEIKRAALAVVRESIDWAAKEDGYVNAAFDFADADMSKKDDEDEEEDMKKSTDAQRRQLAEDAAAKNVKVVDSRGKREFMDANMWKVNAGQLTQAELDASAKEQFGG
ncbi:coil containing protein [Vibrio phage 1.263.B._10N.286.51.B1]|nr:coil containing protein [Vibrio phage 1.263.A._10N.286.51.B1]AUR99264.1 coil containing protein [Vibrio phage 1.263.B._10N.286.51.B1]